MSANAQKTAILPALTLRQAGLLVAIALAAAMTSFHSRLISASLNELCGIWGLSSDQGSVINTMAIAPQLLISPVLPLFFPAMGLRRILLPMAGSFVVISALLPLAKSYVSLLVAHTILGLVLGCFVTATVMITLQFLPPPWWIISFAFFGFRISLGMNAGVSVSALYTEYLGWQWIYWQASLLMLVYALLIHTCLPQDKPKPELLRNLDISGMCFFCLSAFLFHVGMDQGERLGWLHSGLVTACLMGSFLLLAGFVINESLVKQPWAPPRVLSRFNVFMSVAMVGLYTLLTASNSFLITRFLELAHNLKPLQSGDALLMVALLQVLIIPFCIWLVLKCDTRLVCALGVVALALAAWQGTHLTEDWVADNFLVMSIFFACGHPLVFISLMAFCIASFTPQSVPSLIAYIQVLRISTPVVSGALATLFLRQRTDLHAESLLASVVGNDANIQNFLASRGSLADVSSLLSTEAGVRAINDAFMVFMVLSVATLVLLAFLKAFRPTPVSPVEIPEKRR